MSAILVVALCIALPVLVALVGARVGRAASQAELRKFEAIGRYAQGPKRPTLRLVKGGRHE